jgi:hypothetical protein
MRRRHHRGGSPRWAAFALSPAGARGHDERLPERMGMPCRSCAGFESLVSALNKRRIGRLEKRIDTYRGSEPLRRSFRGRLRANSFDVDICTPFRYLLSNCLHRSKRYAVLGLLLDQALVSRGTIFIVAERARAPIIALRYGLFRYFAR